MNTIRWALNTIIRLSSSGAFILLRQQGKTQKRSVQNMMQFKIKKNNNKFSLLSDFHLPSMKTLLPLYVLQVRDKRRWIGPRFFPFFFPVESFSPPSTTYTAHCYCCCSSYTLSEDTYVNFLPGGINKCMCMHKDFFFFFKREEESLQHKKSRKIRR